MDNPRELIKCLICGLKNSSGKQLKDNCDESSLISKHLHVIFLLRNILEVPTDKLVIFLISHPNVESWLSVCDTCSQMVNNCKSTYQAILTAQSKFRTAKQGIIQNLKRSALIKQEITQEEFLDDFPDKSVDIVEEIRGFVVHSKLIKI